MDSSSLEGLLLDPSKCGKLSVDEKREIVYELSKWDQGAPEMLQSWSRQEILQILCAEMGKERKYTGLTKLKIIENLLKIVSEKRDTEYSLGTKSLPSGQSALKRQRKNDNPTRATATITDVLAEKGEIEASNITYCKNSACKAKLTLRDKFCKRCSCCICRKYDDNKDPSLWLTCCSEPPYQGNSCGMSCHLDCAFRNGKSGIAKDGMDGSFFCVACGKRNDLLGCLRKQLIIAKETRRVDILCYRISLGQKIISGTKRYQELYKIVNEAVKKLEADVGPLTGLPVKTARGIVNRLSSGPEVQRLCTVALDSLDSRLSEAASHPSDHLIQEPNLIASNIIQLEDVSSSCVTVTFGSRDPHFKSISGYTFWHRKADEREYAEEPTCKLKTASSSYVLSGLSPMTEYVIKVACFDSAGELGTCEVRFQTSRAEKEIPESSKTYSSSLSNPSSVEDETNNIVPNEKEKIHDTVRTGGICRGVNLGNHNFLFGVEDNGVKPNYILSSDSLKVDAMEQPPRQTIEAMSSDHGLNTHAQTSYDNGLNIHTQMRNDNGSNARSKMSNDNGSNSRTQMSEDNGSNTHTQMSNDNGLNAHTHMGIACGADLPPTPCKLENAKDKVGRNGRGRPAKDFDNRSMRDEEPQDGGSSKKRSGEGRDKGNLENANTDFEYHVKVIRWLECEGHIEANFRQKFLTWYSLRATPQEVRVVKVFVNTLIDDPGSLAGQLVDAFTEAISSKRSSMVPSGFCMKLWH